VLAAAAASVPRVVPAGAWRAGIYCVDDAQRVAQPLRTSAPPKAPPTPQPTPQPTPAARAGAAARAASTWHKPAIAVEFDSGATARAEDVL